MLQLLRYKLTFGLFVFSLLSAFAHGEIHEKIRETTVKIEKNPTNPDLYIERGGYYKKDRDFDHAYADYLTARNIDPTLTTVDFLLAELFYEFDHYASALASINSFEKLKINIAQSHLLKAQIFDKLFEPDSALFYAEASYPHQKKMSTHFFITVSDYVLFADRTDYSRAKKWLETGKARMKYDLVIHEALVDLAIKFDDLPYAEALCIEKIPQLKRKEYWQFKLANVREQQGRKDQALADYQRSLTYINKLPRHHRSTSYIRKLKQSVEDKISILTS